MSRRTRYTPTRAPDASGYVEMRLGGAMMECAWALRGDELSISHWVGGSYREPRDPTQGSVEDQARGMILKLWQLNAERQSMRAEKRGVRGG